MRDVRKAHNYTQQEMADKLGCSVITVKRLEKESGLPSNTAVLRNLKALATLVSVEVEVAA